jgi:hypothetical protein
VKPEVQLRGGREGEQTGGSDPWRIDKVVDDKILFCNAKIRNFKSPTEIITFFSSK